MRRILMFLFGLFASVAIHAQVRYDVQGNCPDGIGRHVYLQLLVGSLDGQDLDSTVVAEDGSFIFQGEVAAPSCAMVSCDMEGFKAIFFDGEPVRLSIEIAKSRNGKDSMVSRVKNPTLNQLASNEVSRFGADYFVRSFSMGMNELRMENAETEKQRDSLMRVNKKLEIENRQQLEDFFSHYADSDVAPFFIDYNMLKYYSLEEVCRYYDRLSERVKQTKKGRELGKQLEVMRQFAPGNPAPDFELPTPEGDTLALHDFLGRVVILDFWASWCAPCLGEMPVMREIYEKYHDKGLEIVGISLDDKRERWVRAIEKEGLVWDQVSSLKGRDDCPVARLYQVIGIPKLYIIDENGKIVANDLRGEALKEKIDELFSE